MRKSLFIFLIPLFFFLSETFGTILKTGLLLSELLPGAPKVLSLNKDNVHFQERLNTAHGKVVTDVFSSKSGDSKSALIIATGVKIAFEDRPNIYNFARILSKLGYVVAWPRHEKLDLGQNYPESPETLIATFNYLKQRPDVNPAKISFLGFSTGSSLAFVAAADPQIADEVRSLLFFGGFYDANEFIAALESRTARYGNRELVWEPSHEVLYYTKENFKNAGEDELVRVIEDEDLTVDSLSARSRRYLSEISPSNYVDKIKAPIFIVHAYHDDRIPYLESQKLENSLPNEVKKDFLITRIFDHVRPKKNVSWADKQDVKEVISFFRFSYNLIDYL